MKPFITEIDSIGEWDGQGQEREAVDCWNCWVAPALTSLAAQLGESDGAEHELWYVREAAWEAFCDTDDEESFPALGQRVAAMVNGWFTQFCTR